MASNRIGEAVVTLSFDGKNVKADLAKVSSDVEKSGRSAGSKWGTAWAVAAGSLLAKGISRIAGIVSSSMDSAISRLDTLNNFPNVMTALGYSADEAGASITQIGDSLDGLPTSLDAMANDVQKLAATMGNLAEGEVNATSVGLALNDMFLAGGKGTAIASAAMEQYNQMLANGKVDMQGWRSIVSAAPGQLDQMAKSILGANANQADLYKAMQEGTVTFEDFNATLVRLNKEGGDSFESFEAQARAATGGIATQMENVQNTMNKIVAAALEGNMADMDKYIAQLTTRVVQLVPTLVDGFTGAFDALTKALPGIMQQLLPAILQGASTVIMALVEAIPLVVDVIVDSLPLIIDGLMTLMDGIIDALPTILPKIMEGLTRLVTTIALSLTRPDFLQKILKGAITMMTTMVKALPKVITELIRALPQVITNIVKFLTDPANIGLIIGAAVELFFGLVKAVPEILGALLAAFGELVGNLWTGIQSMFGAFAGQFGEFIGGIFRGAINGVLAFIENVINTPINILNGFIGTINEAFGWLGVDLGYITTISLPRLAQGGVVDGATTAIIGEAGKEAVIPLENNTDNWAGLLASTLATEMEEQGVSDARPIEVYMTNQINNKMDAQEIGRIMMQSIRRAA